MPMIWPQIRINGKPAFIRNAYNPTSCTKHNIQVMEKFGSHWRPVVNHAIGINFDYFMKQLGEGHEIKTLGNTYSGMIDRSKQWDEWWRPVSS